MPELFFRANAKVERLMGRELITNNVIAIFELVKNSYDAGAREVEIKLGNFQPYKDPKREKNVVVTSPQSYIEISDDGDGMTLNEIKNYWMELGTTHKERERTASVRARHGHMDKLLVRAVNGEKGIGRLGVDKIGAYLRLHTVDHQRTEKTTVHFFWDLFNDTSKQVGDIPCEYEQYKVDPSDKPGLSLTIENLRDRWTVGDVENLKQQLKKFLSPMRTDAEEFRLFITNEWEGTSQTTEIINDSFTYLKLSLDADLNIDGELTYSIVDKVTQVKHETLKLYGEASPFGATKVKLYYLDAHDKRLFTRYMGVRTSDYGNVKIFKDNFRILPYGEPSNDWLEIDKKHAQGIFRSFGTRDLVGYVLLSHDPARNNVSLREATDRVGLIEDAPEFSEFKTFVWNLIGILEEYVFEQLKEATKDTSKVLRMESTSLRRDTQALVADMTQQVLQYIPKQEATQVLERLTDTSNALLKRVHIVEQASKEVDKQIKVYSQITARSGILFDMLHAVKNKLAVIEAQLKSHERAIKRAGLPLDTDEMQSAFKSIYRLITESLNKVNSSKLRKALLSPNDMVKGIVDGWQPLLDSEDVNMHVNYTDSTASVSCALESMKTVFENLLSNSMKAMKHNRTKSILIDINVDEYVNIYFSDNGNGITEDKVPFIFSLWSSNTGGSGIGLASAKDIIEEHGGRIDLVKWNERRDYTTFRIRLPIANSARKGTM